MDFLRSRTAEIIQVELHLNTNFGEYLLLLLHRADLHLSVFYAKQQRFYGGKKTSMVRQPWNSIRLYKHPAWKAFNWQKSTLTNRKREDFPLEFSNFCFCVKNAFGHLKMWSNKGSNWLKNGSKWFKFTQK